MGKGYKSQGQLQKLITQTTSPNATGRLWDSVKAEDSSAILSNPVSHVQDRIDCLSNDGSQLPGNPPILVSSNIDPALQKFVRSDEKPLAPSFVPFTNK